MAKATFVKKAQKDYPEFGIKKGDSYWHWAFAFGPKYKSKTQPTRMENCLHLWRPQTERIPLPPEWMV